MRVRRAVGRGRLERELTPAAVSRLQREQKRSARQLLAKQTPAHRRNRHKTRRATAPAGAKRSAQMPAMPALQVAKHAVSGDVTGAAAALYSSALVASLAALPCGLSSVVADALVCSICTEVRSLCRVWSKAVDITRGALFGLGHSLTATRAFRLQVLHQPVNGVNCPHVFCASCLQTWRQRFVGKECVLLCNNKTFLALTLHTRSDALLSFAHARAPCPMCRTTLAATPAADSASQSKLEVTKVKCTCGTSVLLVKAREHAASCTHVAIASATVAARRGAPPPAKEKPAAPATSFACPLCPPPGPDAAPQLRDADALIQHVMETHSDDPRPAVCPMCAAQPWGDPNQVSRNFAAHVALRHGEGGDGDGRASRDIIGRAESAMLRAVMARSLAEAGIAAGADGAAGAAQLQHDELGENLLMRFEDMANDDDEGPSASESDE